METIIKDIAECKKEVEVNLNYEELTPHFEKAVLDYKKKVQIPGFRKGKAPLSMVKKMYGDSIEYSALENIAEETFKNYLKENKVKIVGIGSMMDLDYKPKENLMFKVQYEVLPEIELENIKGLELTKTVYKIEDSLVDEEINYSKLKIATYEMDGEALDNEYMITFDSQEVDNGGNPIIGKHEKDLKIYLGSKYLEKEYYNGLKGIRENEERTIEVKSKEGEKVRLQLKATKVEKIIYPELNEETYKKLTGRDDIKTDNEYKKIVKDEIQKVYDNVADQKLKDSLVKEVVKLNDVPVPDYYVNVILDDYVASYKKKHAGHSHEHEFNEEEFRKENKTEAIFNSKWYIIKDKIIESEKLEVNDDDYLKMADENAKRFNIPAEKLIEIYKGNEDITSKLLSDKVLDFIIANAKITEVEEIKKTEQAIENEII